MKTRRWFLALVLVAGVVTAAVSTQTSDDGPSFPNIEDHFKYGSVGTEVGVGLPYWIWRVLPIVFEDLLPDRPGRGLERIGFLSPDESDTASHGRPIGTSYRRVDRLDRVGFNCATCHVGTYRESPSSPRTIVLGMPAHQMDLQAFSRFLDVLVDDPRYRAGTLVEAIRAVNPEFGVFERLFYRFFVVGAVKRRILDRRAATRYFDSTPDQGPGRVDTLHSYKTLLAAPMDDAIGTADLPQLWNQRVRQGLPLHWDGNNDSVDERNKSAAIGAGATPESLDLESLDRIAEWLLDLRPPPFPPERIDTVRLDEGRAAYATACARCHDLDGSEIGDVVPAPDIGTDPGRVDSFTPELAQGMLTIGTGHPWQFARFRKTNGYVNGPLDGVWLRAPYLHNGSVPTLRALLFPGTRPSRFFRAYDVYDWGNIGFVAVGPEAEREGVLFDTTLVGNSNAGHTYGAELREDEKNALLEYLKTL